MKIKPLFVAALGAVLAVSLAACGGGAVKEQPGDVPTLRRGISAKVDTLDPHKSSAQWENIVIGDMMIGLTTDDAAGKPVPGMATSWEIDPTGTVWTFKLGDYVWSDGVPVTADDFVFSLRRLLDPKTASEYASLMFLIQNGLQRDARITCITFCDNLGC